MSAKKKWSVITYAGEYAPEVVYGPFDSVLDAAVGTPKVYTATLLPIVDGVRLCVEDNASSALFRRIRQAATHAASCGAGGMKDSMTQIVIKLTEATARIKWLETLLAESRQALTNRTDF